MSDNEMLKESCRNKSSCLKKRHKGRNIEVPSKSPRYMRKKYFPIGQSRKLEHQSAKALNNCDLLTDKKIQKWNEVLNKTDKLLKRSYSFPPLRSKANYLSTGSCDTLCDLELQTSVSNQKKIKERNDSKPNQEDLKKPKSFTCKKSAGKSIFEGQMTVSTECFFPRPHQGQSLTSFLSSNQFNISAELDRENAHFCISDALISAIEHMKCSQPLLNIEDAGEESDEEIRKLTQRIRIRRRERQREKVLKSSIVLLSDGKTDTTSPSVTPPLSSHSSDYDVDSLCSEEQVEDLELSSVHADSYFSSIKETGLSLSMASLYSDADIHKALSKEPEYKKFQESSDGTAAESVALSLLRKFSQKHLPKASELHWLVSEQEAPQRLLPLPDSWPVSPDAIEEEYNLSKMRLRGNLEWAPPRPQIIFFVHPYMKRKDIIERQKFRCAGCGMKIDKNYIKRFRYCEYFGKYFCQCCHSNSQTHIPGRILSKWDFSKYYVSKYAWELLDQMFSDPLFSVQDIHCDLYQKVKQLDLCRNYRMQLFYLKDFVRTCRKADRIQLLLEKENEHIIFEPHTYSLSDFLQVKSGELLKRLRPLVNECLDHVKLCVLCQAKGFICEICQKESDILFPFQFHKVILCQKCGSCFHKRCCKNLKCPRCLRIQERKKRLLEYEDL